MKTKIMDVRGEGGEFVLKLEDSPFRKAGGGQPCDLGTITSEEFEGIVTDVLANNEVIVKPKKSYPEKNMEVIAQIDEKRRSILVRMHTGEHIFFKSLEKQIPTLKLDKIRLDEIESLLVVFGDNITWEHIFKAEEMVNKIIEEARPVVEHNIKKEEVKKKYPEVRIKLDRIKDDSIRIIEVEAFDFSACSGTHCSNTEEVKHFLVTKFNSAGPNKYEIRFKVDVLDDLYKLAKAARVTSSILSTETEKIESTLTNMKDNLEKYKKMSREIKVEVKEENINGTRFLSNIVEIDPKQLMKQANDLLKENTVLFFINRTDKLPQLLIMVSDDLSADAAFIMKKIGEKFNGRGGGKKKMAMGSIETDKFDEVFSYAKELIK